MNWYNIQHFHSLNTPTNRRHMDKLEKTIVGILLGGACVWLCFVFFWWTAALIQMHVKGISPQLIIAAALTGLVIGIILDVLYLKRWIDFFYVVRMWLLAIVYSALCIVLLASFMGLPVGTFALGLLAGCYAGRRQLYNPSGDNIGYGLGKVAFFSAVMTAGTALPIGLLVLREQSVKDLFYGILGISSWSAGVMVVCFLCMVLFGAQYWCSLVAGRVALRTEIKTAKHHIYN